SPSAGGPPPALASDLSATPAARPDHPLSPAVRGEERSHPLSRLLLPGERALVDIATRARQPGLSHRVCHGHPALRRVLTEEPEKAALAFAPDHSLRLRRQLRLGLRQFLRQPPAHRPVSWPLRAHPVRPPPSAPLGSVPRLRTGGHTALSRPG